MAAKSFPLAVDQTYEVQLGKSFSKSAPVSYHSLSYDFKPASVSDKKLGLLEVGRNKEVTITIPNSQHDSTTMFRGSAKEAMKECVLIIEADGTITLEKLSSKVQVKQSRTKEPVLSTPVLSDAPTSATLQTLPEPRAATSAPSLAARPLKPVQFVPPEPAPTQVAASTSSESDTSSGSSSTDSESSTGSSDSDTSDDDDDDDDDDPHARLLEQTLMEPNPAHSALALKSQPSPGLQEDLLMSSDSDTI